VGETCAAVPVRGELVIVGVYVWGGGGGVSSLKGREGKRLAVDRAHVCVCSDKSGGKNAILCV